MKLILVELAQLRHHNEMLVAMVDKIKTDIRGLYEAGVGNRQAEEIPWLEPVKAETQEEVDDLNFKLVSFYVQNVNLLK